MKTMKQVSLKKVVFVLAIALIISVIFNLHYYVNLRIKNENILHTIRARALWTYGAEVQRVAHYLRQYLETSDSDIYEEAQWAIYRAKVQADIFTQGLSEDSGLYWELSRTARTLETYFVWWYEPINTTKVPTIAEALDGISSIITGGFDGLKNKDPLGVLSLSEVDEVISYCRQIKQLAHSA